MKIKIRRSGERGRRKEENRGSRKRDNVMVGGSWKDKRIVGDKEN